MNLVESLKSLGLTDKEAKVYLALLQLGKSTAYNVALRSGLKKPTTYVILDQLVEKGFVYKVPRSKKQLFVAESPDKCYALAVEKMKFTKEALPELMAMKKDKVNKINVAYYEGVRGAEEMYNHMFEVMKQKPKEQRKFVGFYAKGDRVSQELEDYFEKLNEQCHHLGIKRDAITVYHPSIIEKYLKPEILQRYNMTNKALAEDKYSSDISIDIYEQYVQILSQRNLQAILIEDEDVAKALKQIFEMVWNLVEKDRENYLRFSSLDTNQPKPKESEDISITINKIKEI